MSDYSKDAGNAGEKFTDQPEYKNIKGDLKAVKDSSSKLVSDVKSDGPTLAKEGLKEGMKYLKSEGANDIRRLEEYVQNHPGKSVLFAALGGIFLSHLLGRKH